MFTRVGRIALPRRVQPQQCPRRQRLRIGDVAAPGRQFDTDPAGVQCLAGQRRCVQALQLEGLRPDRLPVLPGGFAIMFVMPFVGRLVAKVDPRILIALGLISKHTGGVFTTEPVVHQRTGIPLLEG